MAFPMWVLVLPCGGGRLDQVMDAPHLLCRGLIVCLLLHLPSLSLGGWAGIFMGTDILINNFVVL